MNTQQITHYLDSLEKLAIIQEICENYEISEHTKVFAFEMISYLNIHSIGEFHEKFPNFKTKFKT